MNDKIHLRAERVRLAGTIDLFAVTASGSHVGKPVLMAEHDAGKMILEPTLQLGEGAAQQLMDDLWQAGLRPTEGTGSAGALAATQKHLDDMRAITFNKLNIDRK